MRGAGLPIPNLDVASAVLDRDAPRVAVKGSSANGSFEHMDEVLFLLVNNPCITG
jgi:hypothetical protein